MPAPAAALIGGLPLLLWLQFGAGWWSAPVVGRAVGAVRGALMVSRLPTSR